MATEIKEFDAMRVKNVTFQYADSVEKFKCIGSIEGETELRTITKKCEGVITKSKSIPIGHNLTLSGYVPVKVLRKTFGLTNDKLKTGVYSYGVDSKSEKFCLTADVIDDFEDIVKLVAFPRCISATGLKYTIDNEADETAYVELEFNVNPDEAGQFYYDAFVDEIETEVKNAWHIAFNRSLVDADGEIEYIEIDYSPNGAVTDISDGVTFESDKFIVLKGITSFTFKDDGEDFTATLGPAWNFEEVEE